MHANAALAAAIICGGLAVGLVTADTVWGIEIAVETERDGTWESIASSGGNAHDGPYGPYGHIDCGGRHLRVTVTNDKPWSDTVAVEIRHHNASIRQDTLVFDEDWALGAFESQSHTFRIPDAAFLDPDNDDTPKATPIYLTVRADDVVVSPCVSREAPA